MSASAADPLRVGDQVCIAPQWQDPGGDDFERIVVEAPENSPRVLVLTRIPGFKHHPTEWIEANKLIRL